MTANFCNRYKLIQIQKLAEIKSKNILKPDEGSILMQAYFSDLRRLADARSQEIDLRPSDLADLLYLNLLDLLRMEEESSLDTDLTAQLADFDRLVDASVLARDAYALVRLDSGLVTLDNPVVNAQSVAGFEFGDVVTKIFRIEKRDFVEPRYLFLLERFLFHRLRSVLGLCLLSLDRFRLSFYDRDFLNGSNVRCFHWSIVCIIFLHFHIVSHCNNL